MFKDKDNITNRRVWQLVRIYKTRDGRAFYIVQNRATGLYKRLNAEQAVALTKTGATYNFAFKESYNSDKWLIQSKNNHSIAFMESTAPYIEKRYTPLSLVVSKGKPVMVVLIDEDFDVKVKMSITEMKKLNDAGEVNFISRNSNGSLEYAKEVMRYDSEGNVILSAEQKRFIEKCEKEKKEEEYKHENPGFIKQEDSYHFRRLNKRGKDFQSMTDEQKEQFITEEAKKRAAKEARELRHKKRERAKKDGVSVDDLTAKAFSKAEADGTFDYVPEVEEDKRVGSDLHGRNFEKGTFDWALNEALKGGGGGFY